MHIIAVLVAAGPGTRLGAGEPKAFVPVCGVPLMTHALRSLLAESRVSAAVVACPVGEVERSRSILDAHGPWRCPVDVVEGGAERQDSVRAALMHAGAADLIAIHDAARPFVGRDVVDAVLRSAERHGAAIVAVPSTDTVKRVDEGERIVDTLPRERIWLAQTPQAFRADLIRAAHAEAYAAGITATDDAALVERLGAPVHVVRGNPENRKITTPEDLRWAESFLQRSRRGAGQRSRRGAGLRSSAPR